MFVGSGGVEPPTAGQGIDDLDPGSTLYTYRNDHYNNLGAPGVLAGPMPGRSSTPSSPPPSPQ
jgi:hypothetical protein